MGRMRGAVNILILSSFFFYGWWDMRYLGLIAGGILFNYIICKRILKAPENRKKRWMVLGVTANLGLLGYFKYTDFFIDTLNHNIGTNWTLPHIVLPLGISFFIFQKIAFLVDAYRGEFKEISLRQFTAFVIFFPQLIAGPIPKHNELFSQFKDKYVPPVDWECMAMGISAFAIGLFKKTVIADRLAMYCSPMFIDASSGIYPMFIDAWVGVLAYTFQLYFDFSGYSDMAIGLALLFGYRLPVNFFSPYKATSIIDFWRRWHITLSRFLKDYLYIGLGGNRQGLSRQKINLLLTMLIGGLWHGAAWTFVVWGMLHGLFLCLNHLWRELKDKLGISGRFGQTGMWIGRGLTFMAVSVSWTFFRSDSLASAYSITAGLIGLNGVYITFNPKTCLIFFGLFAWVWFLPNTAEYLSSSKGAIPTYKAESKDNTKTALPDWLKWQPGYLHAGFMAGLVVLATLHFIRSSEFLYFQF